MSWAGALGNKPGKLREIVDIVATLAWSSHPDGSAELPNRRSPHSTLQGHLGRPSSTP